MGKNPNGRGEGIDESPAGPAIFQVGLDGGKFTGLQIFRQVVGGQSPHVFAVNLAPAKNVLERDKHSTHPQVFKCAAPEVGAINDYRLRCQVRCATGANRYTQPMEVAFLSWMRYLHR